jgi:DNA-binding beta-propeller fold protein YncE
LARVWRAPVRVAAKGGALLLLLFMMIGCSRGGKPEAVWLETGAGDGQVVYPRGISYCKTDDSYFVVDRLARIQHIDRKGNFIAGWRMPAIAQGKPVGLTVGPDGNLWVPDTHYSRIMVFSPAGKLLKEFGKFGREKGEFIYPSDIAFDDKGHIFVSEFGDHDRIQVFDKDLHYLYEFGRFGVQDGEFSRPQSMVIDGQTLYVTDACNHRIEVFTTDGRFVRSMGRIGSGPGEFRFPYGMDMDSKGRLVVCEFGNNRVQLIDKETGKGLGSWGVGGRDEGQLAYPWGVAVDKDDRIVAVDAGNNRLQVFEF